MIFVPDLEQARAFYSGVLGFPVSAEGDDLRELEARGVEFLHEAPAEGPLGRYAAFGEPFGIVHELQDWAA